MCIRDRCKHIHLPVQSGSSRILKLMNRKYDREWYMAVSYTHLDVYKRQICIFLIYLILACLYESFLIPFAVIFSVPFGLDVYKRQGEARITLTKFSQGCCISHIPSSVWEIIPEPLTL